MLILLHNNTCHEFDKQRNYQGDACVPLGKTNSNVAFVYVIHQQMNVAVKIKLFRIVYKLCNVKKWLQNNPPWRQFRNMMLRSTFR